MLLATLVTAYVADLTDLQAGSAKAAEIVKSFGNLKQPDLLAQSFTKAGSSAATMASGTAKAADSVASASAKMDSEITEVGERARATSSDLQQMKSRAEEAGDSLIGKLSGGIRAGTSNLIEFTSHLTTTIVNLGQLAQSAASAAIGLLKPAASASELESSLEIFDGSVAAARAELSALAKDAAQSPFDTEVYQQAAVTMQGVGISAKDVRPYILALGDAIDATGHTSPADLQGIVEAFDKIQTTGKLTGDIVQSFADRGINIWAILEQQTGKTQDELRKMVEKGLIPAGDAMKYVTQGIEASPLYHGQMANDAQQIAGAVSNLRGNFNQALVSFGSPILQKLIPIFNNIGKSISDPAFQSFAGSVGTGIATVFGKIGDAVSHIDFKTIGADIANLGTWFNTNLKPALDAAVPKFQDLASTIGGLISGNLPGLISKIGDLTPKIVELAGDVSSGLNTAITTITGSFNTWGPIVATVGSILTVIFIPAIIKSGVESVNAGIKMAVSYIGNIIKTGIEGWQAAGKLTIFVGQLIASGVKAAWAGAVIAAQFVASMAKSAATALASAATISATFVASLIATGAKAAWAGAVTAAQFVGALIRTAAQATVTGAVMLAQLIPSVVSFAGAAIAAAVTAIPAVLAGFGAWIIGALGVAAANIAAFWPIYLAIAVIIGVIALVVLAVQHWGQIMSFFGNLFGTIGQWIGDRLGELGRTFERVFAAIGLFFSALGFIAQGVWNKIVSIFGGVGNWFRDRWNDAINGVRKILSGLGDFAQGVWNGITGGLKGAFNNVLGFINGAIDKVNDVTGKVGIPPIPHIPYLAKGARNFTGLAIVGEAGPELVSLRNQDVYSNADSAALLASNAGSDISPRPTAAVSPSKPQQTSRVRDVTIVMEVNGKKFAKATVHDFGPEMAKELRAVLA